MKRYGIHMTPFVLGLKIAQVILFAGMFASLMLHWSDLPETVPLHYDLMGNPNRWGSKDGLWMLPIIGACLYLLLCLVGRFPSIWNIPCSIKKEKEAATYQCMYFMLQIMNTFLLGLFFYATLTSVLDWEFPSYYIILLLLLMGVPVIWSILHIRKINKED